MGGKFLTLTTPLDGTYWPWVSHNTAYFDRSPQGSNQLVTSPEVSIVAINFIDAQNIKQKLSNRF